MSLTSREEHGTADLPIPVRRILLVSAVLGLTAGLGIVELRSDLTPIYAWLLFLIAAMALLDLVIVVRRTARGLPVVLDDGDLAT